MADPVLVMRRRRFRILTDAEGADAERRFPQMAQAPGSVWLAVLVEEVGKLARCENKLSLATDPAVQAHWQAELEQRLVTVGSIAERWHGHR